MNQPTTLLEKRQDMPNSLKLAGQDQQAKQQKNTTDQTSALQNRSTLEIKAETSELTVKTKPQQNTIAPPEAPPIAPPKPETPEPKDVGDHIHDLTRHLPRPTLIIFDDEEEPDKEKELETEPLPIKLPSPPPKRIHGTGRRKSAVARILMKPGKGQMLINWKPASVYLQENPFLLDTINAPLTFLQVKDRLKIAILVSGGGLVGQADAIKLGISRALCQFNVDFRRPLKLKGYLTRDARVKERKKYGLKKARKAPQFSKR